MDNKISAALILSLGLVISSMIIAHNGGIRFIVEIPTLKVDVPKISVSSSSDIGRYQRFSHSTAVSRETGCFDTSTGIEYRHSVSTDYNKFLKADYKSGMNVLLSDMNED